MKQLLNLIADNLYEESLAHRMRLKRHQLFLNVFKNILDKKIVILDIGGTEKYWKMMNFEKDVSIVLLNRNYKKVNGDIFKAQIGDARNLEFNDKSFDIVFSNSVIEHLSNFNDQVKMANEVRRVGKKYFIQSPNYFFMIEPHFLFPGFQFLPFNIKAKMIQYCNLGHYKKCPNYDDALELAREIRLLTKKEMSNLFPEAQIFCENLLGFTKSFVAYKS